MILLQNVNVKYVVINMYMAIKQEHTEINK